MGTFKMIIIAIGALGISADMKQKITACTLYGVEFREQVDLQDRFEKCKKKILVKK